MLLYFGPTALWERRPLNEVSAEKQKENNETRNVGLALLTTARARQLRLIALVSAFAQAQPI